MAPFQAQSLDILSKVRRAYVALLTKLQVPGRAVAVQKTLGLDRKLAWTIHRLAATREPLECAPFVPSAASARRLVREAGKRGVDDDTLTAIVEATAEFERHVAEHARDRASFDAMVAALGAGSQDQVQLEARRAAFRANTIIHGKASELLVYTFLVRPGARPDTLEAVSIRGHVAMTRLRPDAAVEIARHRFDVDAQVHDARRPLDAETAARCGAPLLGAFSNTDVRHEDDEDGFRRTWLAQPDVGLKAPLTFMLGDVTPDLPFSDGGLGSLCEIATPARRLVHDVIIDEDVPVDAPALRVVASRAATRRWPTAHDPDVLPPGAAVAHLGSGLDGLALLEWSEYASVVEHSLDTLGWDARRLRAWRVLLDYPPHRSVVWMRAPGRAEHATS